MTTDYHSTEFTGDVSWIDIEIPEDAPETGDVDVIVNYTNCVQCGAITARGGRLTPPEGGSGPDYTLT